MRSLRKPATSVAQEIGMMGGAPLRLLDSPDLSARPHHSVKEFSGNAQVGDDLFLRFSGPMTTNNLGVEVVFKFPPLKFAVCLLGLKIAPSLK